jgi:uncharacterized RDD family membrane protein YckC
MSAHESDLQSDLVIDSVTGIDVRLAIAGPGARSYAFIVDWHIRFILAFCWYAFAALVYNGRLSLMTPPDPRGWWFGLVLLPAAAIYFLYHPVLELAMRGRTPGKRMAGVYLVASDGGIPSAGALLIRNVFRLIDSLPAFYAVGFIAVILTREHLRVGDMAAGTLLVYGRGEAVLPAQTATGGLLDAAGTELIEELLSRWTTLDPGARADLALRVLARYAPDQNAAQGAAPGADDDEGLRARLAALIAR